ncbi:hypothetical protein ACFWZ2_40740 [Streptomyces sp. NPDC059002]|uniref:hypothetical protein n=1 Tax=Streptomyces sp. NPDC059002 TaxID=3346690 RepID=UPI0036979B19
MSNHQPQWGQSAPSPQQPQWGAPMPPQEPQRKKNWFARHKVLTAFLSVVAVIVIAAAAGAGKDSGKGASEAKAETKAEAKAGTKAETKAGSKAAPAGGHEDSAASGESQDAPAQEAPEPAAKPVTLSGQGKKVTKKVELSGDYVAEMTVKGNNGAFGAGQDNFIVTGHGPGIEGGWLDESGMANEITGSGSYEKALTGLDGTYYFEVQASGSWTITLTPND